MLRKIISAFRLKTTSNLAAAPGSTNKYQPTLLRTFYIARRPSAEQRRKRKDTYLGEVRSAFPWSPWPCSTRRVTLPPGGQSSRPGSELSGARRGWGAAAPGAADLVPAPARPWPRPKATFWGRRPPKAGEWWYKAGRGAAGKGRWRTSKAHTGYSRDGTGVPSCPESPSLHRQEQPAGTSRAVGRAGVCRQRREHLGSRAGIQAPGSATPTPEQTAHSNLGASPQQWENWGPPKAWCSLQNRTRKVTGPSAPSFTKSWLRSLFHKSVWLLPISMGQGYAQKKLREHSHETFRLKQQPW